MLKKVGILINGGDAPGLNAVIRAITRTAEKNPASSYAPTVVYLLSKNDAMYAK